MVYEGTFMSMIRMEQEDIERDKQSQIYFQMPYSELSSLRKATLDCLTDRYALLTKAVYGLVYLFDRFFHNLRGLMK